VRVVLKLIHNTISQKGIIKLDSGKTKIPKKVRLLSIVSDTAGSNIDVFLGHQYVKGMLNKLVDWVMLGV